jgi:hypothetical protein
MNMLRNILAVITGYAIFVVSAILLFQLSGVDPHKEASLPFILLSGVYGTLFSFLGGLVAQVISKSSKLTINYLLTAIIAGFATFSLFKTSGYHYSQYLAIFLFAPGSLVGGYTYLKRKKV